MLLALSSAAGLRAQTETLTPNEKDFIEFAGEFNLTIVRLGELAQQEALSPKLKEWGRMMQQEHSADLKKLAAVAQKAGGITPEKLDAVHQSQLKRLESAKGAAFDREFLKTVINDHQKALTSFRRESDSGINKNLKAYASQTLPILEQHLKNAKAISAPGK